MSRRWLVIGIGNEMRGDDQLGLQVIQQLRQRVIDADFAVSAADGIQLLQLWADRERVLIIDAVRGSGPPGHLVRIDLADQGGANLNLSATTHLIGLQDAFEIGRALGELPPTLIFYGIEGKNFSLGPDLSPVVQSAVVLLVVEIMAEIES